jgi:hypothetical protein
LPTYRARTEFFRVHGGKLTPQEKTRDKLARLVGMSSRTLEKATQIVNAAQQDPEKYRHLVKQMDARGKVDSSFRELRRLENTNAIAIEATAPAQEASFNVILAIPPWTGARKDNDAAADAGLYQEMSLKDMRKLKLPVAADMVLFLQTPPSHLPSALQLLLAWGFEYRTIQVVLPEAGHFKGGRGNSSCRAYRRHGKSSGWRAG